MSKFFYTLLSLLVFFSFQVTASTFICNTEKTTYKDVCTGTTNHAEVVKLEYDEKTITYEDILKYFFEFHDPTTLNSQGYDFGTQYRSEIFYLNEKQKLSAEKMIEAENKKLNGKVVTQLSLLKNYCTAEEYHPCNVLQ